MNINTLTKEYLLRDLALSLNLTKGRVITVKNYTAEECDGTTNCNFSFIDKDHLDHVKLTARREGDVVVFSIDAELENEILSVWSFNSEKAITMNMGRNIESDAVLGSMHPYLSVWWTFPTFTKTMDELDIETQFLLIKKGDLHIHMMPLCNGNFRAEFDSTGLHLTPGTAGLRHLKGDFLSVSIADDPYKAVQQNYRSARACGAISVPLRDERELPEMFRGFGWCTWNTFYHNVNAKGIFEKLDEFKAKGIPVKWVMIDDGWSTLDKWYLCDFAVDPVKFPDGLASCISRMKSEYGVEKVGVWHAFNGYWMGVKKDSPLYHSQKENLFLSPGGYYLPAVDEEKAFKFWDTWHSYLKDCGVDFLKIDNQSCTPHLLAGVMPTAEAARIAHRAMERSIFKNFDGQVINCMGMNMENVFARTASALSRNSDDFFPERDRGFVSHLLQNAYNAIWHSNMYFCDYDMWWSRHESAVQSGVLRAISGSPIYVSDKIGESDAERIMPTIENNGKVMMCDTAAMPTLDCVYTDCRKSGTLMKIWNRSGDAFAAGVFNVGDENITDCLDIANIPGIDKERDYVMYEYFSGKYTRVHAGDKTEITLDPDGLSVYSIYPVYTENGEDFVMLGDSSKYVPIASENKVRTAVASLV